MKIVLVQFEDSIDITPLETSSITISDGISTITGGTILGLITRVPNPINLTQLRITQVT